MAIQNKLTSVRGPSGSAPRPAELDVFTRFYVLVISLLGILVLLQFPQSSLLDPVGYAVFFVMGGMMQLMPIRFYKDASVSMAMAMALAAILVFGPICAAWVNVASGLVHYLHQIRPKKRPFYRSTVTTGTLVIAAWLSGQVYVTAGGQIGWGSDYLASLPAIILAGLIYYVTNTVLITAAMALEQRQPFWTLLQTNSRWLMVNVASLTPLAVGIALVYQKAGLVALGIYLIPIVLARYSFQLYARSMEDVQKANEDLKTANDHIVKSNQDLKLASEEIHRANAELTRANERLNIMYEVSRSLVGSLHLDETMERLISATRLMGFPAAFVAGPVKESVPHLNWRGTNPIYAEWLLTPPSQRNGKPFSERLVALSREPWFRAAEPRVAPARELGLATAGDDLAILILFPLLIHGEPWGIVGVGARERPSIVEMKELLLFHSMAENAIEMALTHEQAERDALIDARTGLYNHRYFQEALQQELLDAAQRNSVLSFLMIDINKFKHLNDEYGHLVGDQVLQVIGQLLRDSIRQSDIACRYGGDELCVLMRHTDRSHAMEVAARIDRAVQAYPFRVRRQPGRGEAETLELRLRVSIGVATFPEDADTRAGLVEQADRACYRAKALGGGIATEAGRVQAVVSPLHLQRVK